MSELLDHTQADGGKRFRWAIADQSLKNEAHELLNLALRSYEGHALVSITRQVTHQLGEEGIKFKSADDLHSRIDFVIRVRKSEFQGEIWLQGAAKASDVWAVLTCRGKYRVRHLDGLRRWAGASQPGLVGLEGVVDAAVAESKTAEASAAPQVEKPQEAEHQGNGVSQQFSMRGYSKDPQNLCLVLLAMIEEQKQNGVLWHNGTAKRVFQRLQLPTTMESFQSFWRVFTMRGYTQVVTRPGGVGRIVELTPKAHDLLRHYGLGDSLPPAPTGEKMARAPGPMAVPGEPRVETNTEDRRQRIDAFIKRAEEHAANLRRLRDLKNHLANLEESCKAVYANMETVNALLARDGYAAAYDAVMRLDDSMFLEGAT